MRQFLLKKLEALRKKQKSNDISKRQRLLIASLILGFTLFIAQLANEPFRYSAIVFLIVLTIIFSIWSLKEDLNGIEFVTLVTLPILYSSAVGFSYFLFPNRLVTRLPILVLYSTGMYIILLTENVYNVSAIRTIELIRAAHSAGLLLTSLTAFLLFNIIYTFHLPIYLHVFLIGLASFFLILQNVWSIELEERIKKRVVLYTILLSLSVVEISLVLSFWPVLTTIGAILLAIVVYVTLGLTQNFFMKQLTKRAALDYLIFAVFFFFILLLTVTMNRWQG